MLRGGCPRRRHGSLHYHGTLTTTWDSPALGHGNEMPDVTSPSGGVLGAVRPLPILDRRQEDTHGRLTAASEPAIPLQLGREDEVPLFLGGISRQSVALRFHASASGTALRLSSEATATRQRNTS